MPGQPCDLGAALERTLRERVPEAVECSLLVRRPAALNTGGSHCRVKLPAKHYGRRKETVALSLEDEAVAVR